MARDKPNATSDKATPWRADERLRQLEWAVVKRLDGILQGDWRSLFRGHGLDLAELREYQHHDDVRRIDWHVTARMNQPYVREYLEDREAAAWFVLDLSASVDFGTRARKRSVAADLTGVLASALTRKGHRVGALLYGSGVESTLPARQGRRHVMELMHRIEQRPPLTVVQGGTSNAAAKQGQGKHQGLTQLDTLLKASQQAIKGRSAVFVISDFISAPGWQAPMARLVSRHDVIAVRIVDPAEREMPDVGLVPLMDAETGDTVMVDTGSASFRKRYAELSAVREQGVRESLAEVGVDTLEITTDEDMAQALLRFVHARRTRAQLSGGGSSWLAQQRAKAANTAPPASASAATSASARR
jgi:uncharacterized protein (DUF58 family)